MRADIPHSAGQERTLCFGPFRLVPARRLLLEEDRPVRLGTRALDLLIALVERRGETLGKTELVDIVWPDTFVEEANLRVHIGALRRVLGDGRSGNRYIVNMVGRGYCFVAPVLVEETQNSGAKAHPPALSAPRSHVLPTHTSRLIGRDDCVNQICGQLSARRFVSLIGPGGIGKTAAALAVTEQLAGQYAQGIHFVDLSTLTRPELVASTVAAALGRSATAGEPLRALAAHLAHQSLLLVLDSCEPVIEAAAQLSEYLLRAAPRLHVLATSRESLRAEGEWVHRLPSLDLPPPDARPRANELLSWPAPLLFIERAMAAADGFELADADVPLVIDICRRLDGIPLAIELAAARVELFGLLGLADRLDSHLLLFSHGRRTVLPRHQTLRATLDWSHRTLTGMEQRVLQRLSCLQGAFTLAEVIAIAGDDPAGTGSGTLLETMGELVAKSLVGITIEGEEPAYRLSAITRAYAASRLAEAGEANEIARRHCQYCLSRLEAADREWPELGRPAWLARYAPLINDIRAALEWAFSAEGELMLGLDLVSAANPLAFQLSLLEEHRQWVERALAALAQSGHSDPRLEMRLNISLGQLTQQISGPSPLVTRAFNRVLEIAGQIGDTAYQADALMGMWVWAFGVGDYPATADFIRRLQALPGMRENMNRAALTSRRMDAQTSHFLGDHATADRLAREMLTIDTVLVSSTYNAPIHVDHQVSMRILLSRILWIQGRVVEASEMVEECLERALGDNFFAYCQALAMAAGPVALWSGEDERARDFNDRLRRCADQNASPFWASWAHNLDTVLTLRARPRPLAGLSTLPIFGAKQIDMLATLAPELVSEEAVARVRKGAVGWCAPEVLRAQALHLMARSDSEAQAMAEALLVRSLDLARQQGARSWELRTATTLAGLMESRGEASQASALIDMVLARCDSAWLTSDLAAARALAGKLRQYRPLQQAAG
ncbi:ATP-binding protein [Radicibacter daui]|uniref:ATP-binding protein n=1 Tax=Radicibacter daui TaxID=3064829 RepID=UPI00404693B3